MFNSKPSTKDLLKVLDNAELLKNTLDKEAKTHDLLSGLVTELSVGVITLTINKMSILLIGSAVLSNPVLLGIFVTSGMLGTYYPKIQAFMQRHYLYRNYSVISSHIDHVIEVANEFNKSNK